MTEEQREKKRQSDREYMRRRRAIRKDPPATTEQKAKRKEYYKEYRAANAERIKAADKIYRAANMGKSRARQKAWCTANAERIKPRVQAYNRERRLTQVLTEEQKAKQHERNIEYRLANGDRLRGKEKEWRDANKEQRAIYRQEHRAESAAQNKAWFIAHPLEARLLRINKFARSRGCTDKLTIEDLRTLLASAGGICPACHVPFGEGRTRWTLDHVVPVAQSHLHTIANCQLLCNKCNDLKGETVIRYQTPSEVFSDK